MYIMLNKYMISILLNRDFICIYNLFCFVLFLFLFLFVLFFLVTGVGFFIYKSCYISVHKTKHTNVYRIFVNEYTKRIKGNKTLQMCTFLMKVNNYIHNVK